jgi:hypothetical protein
MERSVRVTVDQRPAWRHSGGPVGWFPVGKVAPGVGESLGTTAPFGSGDVLTEGLGDGVGHSGST